MRNKTLTRIIIATLLCALLVNTGRATRVFALADPVPITAVYDTQIIQLADYVDSLPQPSVDIFYILCGVLAAAQLGGQEYKLDDPYATSSDVIDWFKSLGIRLYNTVIGLAPNRDPILGFDVRPYVKPLVAAMMGNAVLSRNYGSVQEFLDSDDEVLVPFHRDIQKSINVIWQIQGGPYHWQFDSMPWTSTFNWRFTNMSELLENAYKNAVSALGNYISKCNVMSNSSIYNAVIPLPYHLNIFLNTSNSKIYLCNDSGTIATSIYSPIRGVSIYSNNIEYLNYDRLIFFERNFSDYPGETYLDIVHNIFNSYSNVPLVSSYIYGGAVLFDLASFIEHVYVGENWVSKQEIFNLTDLNISEDGNDYYFESPESDTYLIDIKNLINDLVNKTNIWDVVIDHLFDIDGIKINAPIFGRISVSLDEIIERLAPPIPVDLNEIALYTENDYLDQIKERSQKFGETLGEYFVFWHNSDPLTVYVIFGSIAVILIGAFVGKWGHS